MTEKEKRAMYDRIMRSASRAVKRQLAEELAPDARRELDAIPDPKWGRNMKSSKHADYYRDGKRITPDELKLIQRYVSRMLKGKLSDSAFSDIFYFVTTLANGSVLLGDSHDEVMDMIDSTRV